MTGIEAKRLIDEATELAFPRAAGTPGDRKAVDLLQQRLHEAGFDTDVEPFSYDVRPALRAMRMVLVVAALLVAGAGAVAADHPAVASALLAAVLLPGAGFLAWSPWLGILYRRDGPTETANVVGRRRAESPSCTVIVMAHHDSKSQSLSLPYRVGVTAAAIAGALGVMVVLVSVAIGSPLAAGRWLAPASGGLAGCALLVLSTIRSANLSPGGVDNAGSLAVLLALARSLPSRVSDGIELLFLSTGAEEDLMVGAVRWLDAHAAELEGRPVWCLNLDGVGAPGRAVLIERYGFGRLFSRELSAAARRAASRLGLRPRGILMLPGLGIDAIPFAHRGVPCLTLASGSLGRATMSVHSARDLPEHLDADTLASLARLAQETVLEAIGAGRYGRVEAGGEVDRSLS